MNMMEDATLDELAGHAADALTQGAIVWWTRHFGRAPNAGEAVSLIAEIKAETRPALEEAIRDAEGALSCGMKDVARQTFAASLVRGGIRAAKRAAGVA